MHDGSSTHDGVCVKPTSRPYGTSTPAPSAGSPPSTAPAVVTVNADGGTSGPPPADGSSSPSPVSACGGYAATGGSVRVVDKPDLAPTLGEGPPNLADGSYALVQATFFSTGQSASPVRSLKAALDVRGPTLTVNAQDTSVAGLPNESLTFLLAPDAVATKTCESVHGSVSAWFFPFSVGKTTQTQARYDGASGFVRILVARADGATELVFAQ
jgi:hypothetical protein